MHGNSPACFLLAALSKDYAGSMLVQLAVAPGVVDHKQCSTCMHQVCSGEVLIRAVRLYFDG